ncbi:MAG: glycosyltransferase [Microthrixaceae bacterium]|nr:glycosyltransferase [Microthrixaceae bacterium]
MTRPLLVVAHEATRTGAPRVLLDLMRFARGRITVPVAVRLEAEGPLSRDLRDLADTEIDLTAPCAVLVNGSAAAGMFHGVQPGIPTMAYVHEEQAALEVLPKECIEALVDRCDRVLSVSERSAATLGELGVDPSRIRVLPPVVPCTRADSHSRRHPDAARPGARRGPATRVGMRRSRVAQGRRPVRRRCPAHPSGCSCAVRLGRSPAASVARLLDADTRLCGLSEDLMWLGELEDVGPVLTAAQVLVMTSREDPQPLVALEAAAMGTATAGFAVGGIADLQDAGAASAVPYPDTVALAREVTTLLSHPEQRGRLACEAENRRSEQHSIEVLGERFLAELTDLIGSAGR